MRDSENRNNLRDAAGNTGRILLFALILGIILYTLSATVFDGARWFEAGWIINRNARVAAIEAEEPETIDILAIGNSLSVSAFTPMELWEEYGWTSFNCSQDGENPVECYYVLARALQEQNPTYCLIETDMLFQPNKDMMLREVAFKMPWQNLFPMIRYHNVWMTPFQVHPFRKYFKGYLINGVVSGYSGEEYYTASEEREEIKPIYLHYFRRTIRLCQEKGIIPVLYSAPSPDNYTMARHNALADLAQELGVEYWDLNTDLSGVGIDWETDTRDGGMHVNQSGAEKVTLYLGQKLAGTGSLPDRRQDPAFRSWEDLVLSYEITIEEMRDTCYTEMEDGRGIEFW